MDTIKFSEKMLSNLPMAYFFSATQAFKERIAMAEFAQERFVKMRTEYYDLFAAFDEAYKRSQKSMLTAKIGDLDAVRDRYAYVIQNVAELWGEKLPDEDLATHGRRVAQVFASYGFRTREALVAENAKIHNIEQAFSTREMTTALETMGLADLNRRLTSITDEIEHLMSQRNEEKSEVVTGELKAAREKLDLHYRAFITYLNAVQELQPDPTLSKAAQFYNADLEKIERQYAQSRHHATPDDPEPDTPEAPAAES